MTSISGDNIQPNNDPDRGTDYSLVVHGLHHPGLALPEHLLLLLLVRRRLRQADLQRRTAQVAPVQLLKMQFS